jgi:hypothetical protein
MTNVKLPRDEASPKLVYFSMRVGGDSLENQQVQASIRGLTKIRDELVDAPEIGDLRVDLTFEIPGPYYGPDYPGLRTGSFFRKDRVLVIQIAVPRDVADISRYLVDILHQASEIARGFARRRKLTLSPEAFERALELIISRVEQRS